MDRCTWLFQRHLGGDATEEEHAELILLLQDPENEKKTRSLLRQSFMNPADPMPLPAETSASILAAITRVNKAVPGAADEAPSGDSSYPAGMERDPVRLPFRWRKTLSVAAILLLTVAAIWLWVLPKTNHPASQAKANLPQPGGEKAILTLANGTTILLDSAANGTIAAQGKTRVVKLANGQLAYQVSAGHEATPVYNTMATPRGGGYQLVLPDGSRVWLNSASSIRFPTAFTGNQRRVAITGEAYFEVARNDKAPFLVETRGLEVQVLGTEFNLMAYTDEEAIKTTLVSGAVKVLKGAETSLLRPGQQASLPNGGDSFQVVPADLEEALAWREGKFRFSKSDVKVIMRQIARWYDVDIVYKGKVPDIEFSGVFPRKEYVSQLLEVLEDAVKVHFDTEGNTITVTAAK